MKRIWFNHWFSTAYNIIKMIRADNLSFQFIGTNENERSLIATVCDEWYTEPRLKGDEYVAYCIDFCLTHQIDAFLPRRELLAISKRKQDFEDIGVKVMVDDFEIVSILNHKDEAYAQLRARAFPPYRSILS